MCIRIIYRYIMYRRAIEKTTWRRRRRNIYIYTKKKERRSRIYIIQAESRRTLLNKGHNSRVPIYILETFFPSCPLLSPPPPRHGSGRAVHTVHRRGQYFIHKIYTSDSVPCTGVCVCVSVCLRV